MLQTTLVIHAEMNYTWKRHKARMEQRFYQRKRDYKCLAIWSCTAIAKGAYDYPCDGSTDSKPYRGRTAAGLYVGTNQIMLAVNRLRLKVQRKLLMICAGPKQACLRTGWQSI